MKTKNWISKITLIALAISFIVIGCEKDKLEEIYGDADNKTEDCVASERDSTIGCFAVYDPVCGCNHITYSNSCEAEAHGITDYSSGECIRKKIIKYEEGFTTFEMEYNENGLLSKFSRPTCGFSFIYNMSNQVTDMNRTAGSCSGNGKFEYDNLGKLVARSYYNGGETYSTYSYDASGNIVEVLFYEAAHNSDMDSILFMGNWVDSLSLCGSKSLTYNDQGNVVKEEMIIGTTVRETFVYEHDNKINPLQALRPLYNYDTEVGMSLSPNNVTKRTYTYYPTNFVSTTIYSYTYDSNGHPTIASASGGKPEKKYFY